MDIKMNSKFVKYIYRLHLEIFFLKKNIQFIIDNQLDTNILNNKKQQLCQKQKILNLINKNIEEYISQNISSNNFIWNLNYIDGILHVEVKNNE